MLTRRKSLQLALSAIALPAVSRSAWAQSYPARPVRVLVGFVAGGPADLTARIVSDKLAAIWGKPIIIENIGGAAGNTATERAAKAEPDGYTLLLGTPGPHVYHKYMYAKLGFDPDKDFVPITQLSSNANLLVVNNDIKATTAKELADLARAEPGKLTYASPGAGTSQHLAAELFKSMARLDIQHVPYRGVNQVMPDVISGQVNMTFGSMSNTLALAREGRVRGLAVTSLKRDAVASEFPTMDEAGFPGFNSSAWFAFLVPAGTPATIISKIHQDSAKVLEMPEVRKRFTELGMSPIGNSPAEFAAAIKAEMPQWERVIKSAGIKAE